MASGRLILPLADPAILGTGALDTGATLTVYNTGTLTLASLFADSGLVTPITNPQVSNSAGRFYDQTTLIWGDATVAYDCKLAFSDGSSVTYSAVYLLGAQAVVSGFAPIDSPHFTGVPTAPTPASNDSSTKIATTAYVQSQFPVPLSELATQAASTVVANNTAGAASPTAVPISALATALGFTSTSLGTSGHITLPGGLIFQWGHQLTAITNANQSVAVTMPVNFPSACYGALAIIDNSSSANSIANVMALVSITTTTATFRSNGYQSGAYVSVPGFYWLAWGS